jgi:multidrug resistance efflux pump
MKRTIIISAIVVALAIIVMVIIGKATSRKDVENLFAEAKRGQFDIIVTTTGELQAENSTDILGPQIAQSRNIRVMDIKITDLVPEGTEVKAGDYVATLDRTTFDNTLKDEIERLVTQETNLEVKVLDTAVTLSNLRDNIKNLRFAVEEAEITLQQSKYEPPTTIRQAEIALDRAARSLDQAIRGYALRVEQARSDMRNLRNNLAEQRQRVADLQDILSKFIISAPSDGMVIYKRDRTGAKRRIGSSISAWDNVVATLPDMSTMISRTYVNEIDVSKVKANQPVEIIVDAFPERSYTGSVISVANIGEQLPNADAKVFEVLIKVNGSDPILRPSMTTGNKIVTKSISDVVYIPLETVQATPDSIPFVYTKNGYKQIVLLGESNENSIIVEQGLEAGTSIYLSTPADPERFKLGGEELIAVNKDRAKARRDEEMRMRQETGTGRQRLPGMEGMTPEMMERFQNMRQNMQPGQGAGTRQGGARDTSARRTMNVQRNPQEGQTGVQQGAARDTTVRRPAAVQPAQQNQ